MIETILNVISLLKNTIYYSLLASYQTGQIIIYVTLLVCSYFKNAFDTITTLLKIGCEDFEIFVWDILEHIAAVVGFLAGTVEGTVRFLMSINSCISSTCELIYYTITTTYLSILGFVHKIASTFIHLVAGIKFLFVLLGSGVWFALTIIPVTVFYTSILFTYYIGLIFDEIGSFISCSFSEISAFCKSIVAFFWDIPIEAMLGLIFISCIIYTLSKFYIMLYRYFGQKIYLMNLIVQESYVKVKSNFKIPVKRNKASVIVNADEEMLFCVVCQERQKCVLILPCKHLCMCNECNKTMQKFFAKCPICRTKVERTMKVFV